MLQRIRVKRCCVPGCEDTSARRFSIPADERVRNVWLDRIENPNFDASQDRNFFKSYVVCGQHFHSMCLDPASGFLLRYSVPTLRLPVTVAGIRDLNQVECSRGVKIVPDVPLSQADGPNDVIIMPGGLGGTKEMIESEEVGQLLKEQEKSGRIIAAICAAPTALKAHGIFLGKSLTSYPAMKKDLVDKYTYKEADVVIDGNLITSRGPGTACQFALTIVENLISKEKAHEVAKAMLYNYE